MPGQDDADVLNSGERLDTASFAKEQRALQTVLSALGDLEPTQRSRILDTVLTFFGVAAIAKSSPLQPVAAPRTSAAPTSRQPYEPTFGEQRAPSPKEFLVLKAPRTDVERIACLAYYLTHYRDSPDFKTPDLVALNTEAAQPRFSNPSNSTKHAATSGYLAPAVGGRKQLSAAGEQFVLALPDREAARQAMELTRRPRRRARSGKQSLFKTEGNEGSDGE